MAELVWEGKYDANGKRVGPVRVALPFQTVETVNESAQERDRSLFADETPWRNRLIWGDKKYVLPSLLPELEGKVDLIYIDPPFHTEADFTFWAKVPTDDSDDLKFKKTPSIIELKAYRDTWGKGIDSYLKWFDETAILLFDLLSPTGTMYVHLDFRVGHQVKCSLMIYSLKAEFLNQIIWQRNPPKDSPLRS